MTEIRSSAAHDVVALQTLYDAAFPTEDLVPLVSALLDCADETLSLVAIDGTDVIGHIVLTFGMLEEAPQDHRVALLGPLCVSPARQLQGLGSMLIHAGLERLRDAGVSRVMVLGDPAYYDRFGFQREAAVIPPYAVPEAWRDAWQSLSLDTDAAEVAGRLVLPAPWLRRELWSP